MSFSTVNSVYLTGNSKKRKAASRYEKIDAFFMAKRIAHYLVLHHSDEDAFHKVPFITASARVGAMMLSPDPQRQDHEYDKICDHLHRMQDTLCTDCFAILSRKDSLRRHKARNVCHKGKGNSQHVFHLTIL